MVPAKETAEEQLLRMIEGPSGPSSHPKSPIRGFSAERLLARWRTTLEALRRRLIPLPQRERSDALLWRLQVGERIMWAVLAGLGIYLVIDVFVLQLKPPTLASTAAPPATDLQAAMTPVEPLRPLAEYRQTLAERNPFALAVKSAAGTVGNPEQAKGKLEQLASSLSVVGINRGRVPEVLVEDTTTNRTYFLKVGDEVNGLMVKAIDQSGVTVTYEGEETILH